LSALAGVTYGYDVKADLERAADRRETIRGIVLELDTPGGTVVGSRAIADAVAAFRERTGRPVVAYVRGRSLSGGMYAMAGADRVVADHGTLVGSIGVVFGPLPRYRDVVAVDGGLLGGGVETTGGITEEYITAGRSKDIGNPYRDLTDEERRTLQRSVDVSYGQFVDHVAAGRSISAESIRGDLGALLFDEETARSKGLVDEVGNRDEAYALAAELAGLEPGNWQVVRRTRDGGGFFGLGARLTGLVRGEHPDASTPVDPAAVLCAGGPMLLAYHGPLPRACN
jgi:protease-4